VGAGRAHPEALTEVRWTAPAADDLENITRYISRDNPDAARRAARNLYDAAMSLDRLPDRGRLGRIAGTRELIRAPYIIVYRVTADAVEILRVYHGAQNRP
jgi:toxin ParE1/3/4